MIGQGERNFYRKTNTVSKKRYLASAETKDILI